MEDLQDFLKDKKYKKIKFKVLKTQHLLIKATINNVKGSFILDTGASNSCIGFESIRYFKLTTKTTKTTASGAGAIGMETLLSNNNILKLRRWSCSEFRLVIFDLTHINQALMQYKVNPIQGIIGADVLLHGKAIIDYYNHYLYLK